MARAKYTTAGKCSTGSGRNRCRQGCVGCCLRCRRMVSDLRRANHPRWQSSFPALTDLPLLSCIIIIIQLFYTIDWMVGHSQCRARTCPAVRIPLLESIDPQPRTRFLRGPWPKLQMVSSALTTTHHSLSPFVTPSEVPANPLGRAGSGFSGGSPSESNVNDTLNSSQSGARFSERPLTSRSMRVWIGRNRRVR